MEIKNYKKAGFAIRFLATIEELLLTGIFYFGLLYFFTLGSNQNNFAQKTVLVGTAILMFLFLTPPICAFYYVILTNKFGGTVGKLIFQLRVVEENSTKFIDKKTAFYRTVLGYIFSGKFFGLGFYQTIRHKDKRAWHDELFETRVISIKDSWMGYAVFALSLALLGVLGFLTVHNVLQIF